MTSTISNSPAVRESRVVGHGDMFTDHMVTSTWTGPGGWSPLVVGPCRSIPMHPAMIGLHYSQVVFEGLKAHRQIDGATAIFRPRANAARFRRSAARFAMPPVREEHFVRALEELVRADGHQLPDDPELSLYLRPIMFATETNLMLRPSREYMFLVMAFVAGGFFGPELKPVSVWVNPEHGRAMPGGTGDVKCAANYGPAFVAQQRAEERGCQQVVWLDSTERRWVEELGGMNLFFVRGAEQELVTPPLGGTLLPGVTRDSLITIAHRLGYRVREESVSLDQWRDECRSGRMSEVFACGTAAVVTPVGRVVEEDVSWTVGGGESGPVTMRLRRALVDVYHGVADDPDGWMHRVG